MKNFPCFGENRGKRQKVMDMEYIYQVFIDSRVEGKKKIERRTQNMQRQEIEKHRSITHKKRDNVSLVKL